MLEVKNGSFSYNDSPLLKDLSFCVENREIFAVLGRNGAGKTTLLKCLMGFLDWERGAAFLNGENIKSISRRRFWAQVAYVPQAKRGADCTVRDMAVMGRSAHIGLFGKPSIEDYAIADQMLERLYIHALADKSCNQISGGELQLVLIARALTAMPQLLILDEPESNLDYHNQAHILDLISEISKTTTCILNTHYPEHALRIAAKSLLLMPDGGALVGDTEQVITEHSLKRAFSIDTKIGAMTVDGNDYPYIITLGKHPYGKQ